MINLNKRLGAIVLLLVTAHCTMGHPVDDRAAAARAVKASMRPDEIVLSFAGDCTFGTVNSDDSSIRFPALYQRSHLKNYPFALVQPWFVNDDLTVVNFECTLTNATKTADKQWKFKGDASYASIYRSTALAAVHGTSVYRRRG